MSRLEQRAQMGDGGVYQWNPDLAEGWQLIADLGGMGLELSRWP